MQLELKALTVDFAAQMRARMNDLAVDDYAAAMEAGATFPPVVVFEEGEVYYLGDGFHRVEATRKCGFADIEVDVRTSLLVDGVEETGRRAALLYSAGANDNHGLRRSNADKRRAVEALLTDEAWSKKSDRWISRVANVSNVFVSKIRATVNINSSGKREGQDGKVRSLPRSSLDETTRSIIRETPLVDDPRELHNLARIKNEDERHEAARKIRDGEHTTVQLARREIRHRRTMEASLEIDGKFFVILADPPWRFANTGVRGAAEDEYPTMSLEELLDLEVTPLAQDDSVLFLWSTNTHVREALEVISAWGFAYTTNFVWEKPNVTRFRFYHRAKHELLFLATRGTGLMPPGEALVESVIHAASSAHSQKPEEVYEIIERYYPNAPKLELFARRRRPGWTAFGNEILDESGPGVPVR